MPKTTVHFEPFLKKSTVFLFCFFFLVRKIGHELTSVASLPLFCTWDAWHSVCRSVPGIRTREPQAAEAECVNFTTVGGSWEYHSYLPLLEQLGECD